MNKETKKRLDLLEAIAAEHEQKRQEESKTLRARLIDNVAYLKNGHVVGERPIDAIAWLEQHILMTKPENVVIGVEQSGVCDLLPGLETIEEGRELDLYFVVGRLRIEGDYYPLILQGIPLNQIILVEILIPYLRRYVEDGSALSMAGDLDWIISTLLKSMNERKETVASDVSESLKQNSRPSNEWSKYWQEGQKT